MAHMPFVSNTTITLVTQNRSAYQQGADSYLIHVKPENGETVFPEVIVARDP